MTEKEIEYWKSLTEFKKNRFGNLVIPSIPVCDSEQHRDIIVPALIRCGAIPKDKLITGKTYIGDCRNAEEAVWGGETFIYKRYKFGMFFEEEINHFMDDDGHDLFIPIKLKEE